VLQASREKSQTNRKQRTYGQRAQQVGLLGFVFTVAQNVVRATNGKTLPLSVPHELRDVLAVVLTKHLKILAFFENSEIYWSGLAGKWVGVPVVKRGQLSESDINRSSLLSSLELDVQEAKTTNKTDRDWAYNGNAGYGSPCHFCGVSFYCHHSVINEFLLVWADRL